MGHLFTPQTKLAGGAYISARCFQPFQEIVSFCLLVMRFCSLPKRGFRSLSTESVWKMPWCVSTIMHPSEHGPRETGAFDTSSSCVQIPLNTQWLPSQQQPSRHLKVSRAFALFQGIVPRCWQTLFHGN